MNTNPPNNDPNNGDHPNDDFLYALRAELPRDFGRSLYARLMDAEVLQENEEMAIDLTPKSPLRAQRGDLKNSQLGDLNGYDDHEKLSGVRRKFPLARKPLVLGRRGQGGEVGRGWLTIAALLAFTLLGALLIVRVNTPQLRSIQPGAQPTPPSLDALKPITAENVDTLTKLYTLGKGTILSADWSPDGKTIALGTSTGVRLHSADDLSAPETLLGGQPLSTSQVFYSPDGEQVIGRREDNTIYLWDARTGEVLNRFVTEQLETVMGFTPDAAQFVTFRCVEQPDPNQACVKSAVTYRDVTTGEEDIQARVTFDNPFWGIEMSDDYSTLLNRIDDKTLRVMRLSNPVRYADIRIGEINPGYSLSPDGSLLALTNRPTMGGLEVIDVETLLDDPGKALAEARKLRRPSGVGGSYLSHATFFHDNSRLIVKTTKALAIFDLSGDGEIVVEAVPLMPGQWSRPPQISPDGRKLLVMAEGSILLIYDLETGELLTRNLDYNGSYNVLHFSPDSQRLAASSVWEGSAHIFELATEPPIDRFFEGNNPETLETARNVQFSPDGSEVLYSVGNSGTMLRHDLQTGETERVLQITYGNLVAFASDGSILQLSGDRHIRRIRSARDYDFVFLPDVPDLYLTFEPRGGFSPDGRIVIASVCLERVKMSYCVNGQLQAYSMTTGALIGVLEGIDWFQGGNILFSKDGRYLVAFGCDKIELNPVDADGNYFSPFCKGQAIRVWDISPLYAFADATPDEMQETDTLAIAPLTQTAVPDMASYYNTSILSLTEDENPLLLAVGGFEVVDLYRIDPFNAEMTLLRQIETVAHSTAFSPDGKILAVGRWGMVELWGTAEE